MRKPRLMSAAALSLAAISFLPAAAQAATLVIDVTDIDSIDGFGDPDNFFLLQDIGANSHVTGIGWNLTLYADSPSWLSEIAIYFDNTALAAGVTLRPGAGVNSPGVGSYSGFGNLVDLGLDFSVLSDGLLYLEFFETFDDYPNEWDGFYVSGTITVEYEPSAVVPEPATWAMMISGFGMVGGAMRRRKLQAGTPRISYAA